MSQPPKTTPAHRSHPAQEGPDEHGQGLDIVELLARYTDTISLAASSASLLLPENWHPATTNPQPGTTISGT